MRGGGATPPHGSMAHLVSSAGGFDVNMSDYPTLPQLIAERFSLRCYRFGKREGNGGASGCRGSPPPPTVVRELLSTTYNAVIRR
jgi:hypothetical protein